MLLQILGLVGVDYLFTPDQTRYTGCYRQDTMAEYNRNVGTVTVLLNSAFNESCSGISRTLEAHLIMRDNTLPIVHTVVSDFDYKTTTQIIFTNVPDLTSKEVLIELYLFSFADIVPIDILIFDEIRSSLGDCFLPNSRIRVDPTELELQLTPTLLCSAELRGTGQPENTLSRVALELSGSVYELSPLDISSNYESALAFTINLQGDFSTVVQLQRLKGRLLFTITQGSESVTFHHQIAEIEISGLHYGPNTFYDIENTPYVGMWNGKFIVKAANSPDFTAEQAAIEAVKFTHYAFRLECVLNKSEFSGSIERNNEIYIANEKIYEFTCDAGGQAENRQCAEFYRESILNAPECTFSTVFYNGEKLAFIEQIRVEKAPSCWDDAVIEVRKSQFCLGVELLPTGWCAALLRDQKLELQHIYMNIITRNESTPDLRNEVMGKWDPGAVEFCAACQELFGADCEAFQKRLLSSKNLAFEMQFLGEFQGQEQTLYLFGQRVTRGSYAIVEIVVGILGAAVVVGCLSLTIFGVVRLMQRLKRKKRLK